MYPNNEVKKAPVDIIANVTETFDTLMAPKKVSQCTAMINPAIKKPNNTFFGNLIFFLAMAIYKRTKTLANPMRYQTKGIASSEINAPITAVNPQIKTIKWRCR